MLPIIFVAVFLLGMTAIGIWGMRKTKSVNDFFLGGRTIGPWVSAVAYGTTYFSAVLFIGFAGTQGWLFGFQALWIAGGNVLFGALLAWIVLARRTRRMTQNLEAMTMPEYFKERFDAPSLKIVSALIIFIFLVPYSASVFKGLSHLFEATFHIPYIVALLVMLGVTGLYLVLGGYFAVTLTDFIQGVIMIFGALAMVAVFSGQVGGLDRVIAQVPESYAAHIPVAQQPSLLTIAAVVFMTSFGTWGLPQMVQKFYSIRDEKRIPVATIVTTVFALVIVFCAYFTGAMTHLFFSPDTLPKSGGEPAFDQLIPLLITRFLPELLVAVIVLLVLSASMSTISSLVLVSASALTIDLYQGSINPRLGKKQSLVLIRFMSGFFVLLSFFLASVKIEFIVPLMSISWGCIAGSFLAPYLLGLYWKRTTKPAVFAGMITGLTTALVLYFTLGSAMAPLASSIAILAPFPVVIAVSLVTKPPRPEVIAKAFGGIGR